jgi:hypothetical protein
LVKKSTAANVTRSPTPLAAAYSSKILRRAGVDEGLVLPPGKLPGDGHVCAVADARHRGQERTQSSRLGVQRRERRRAAALRLVLRLAGPQPLGELVPVAEQARVGHLEDAADIRRLLLVEEEAGLRRVRVDVAGALQEAERDQRVEEVEGGARVQAERGAQIGRRGRLLGETGEQPELHRAQ